MPSTEVLNAVSPWMGRIAWIGEPRTGKTKKGSEWRSIDFAVKYTDVQGQERDIAFSLFGSEKVDKVVTAGLGAEVKVMWRPESHEYNGRWYSKFEAFDVIVLGEAKKEPERTTALPAGSPSYAAQQTAPETPDGDLPFSQSPGVRG